jgi:peptidoglycan hydrolase-like protein with peptidoglycan-binding domain
MKTPKYILVIFVVVFGFASFAIFSNSNFVLIAHADNPPIPVPVTVIYPNGGEVFQAGQQMPTKWISSGYSANALVDVNLMIHNPNGTYTNPSLMNFTGLVNDGTETFTIPTNVPNATNYAILVAIYEPSNGFYADDYSDGDFEITNPIPLTECSDSLDNDRDLLIDIFDPGCHTDGNASNQSSYDSNDNREADNVGTLPECSDSLDNDRDGAVDYPADSGCTSSQDNSELELFQLGTCGTVISPLQGSGDMTNPLTYNIYMPSNNSHPGNFVDHSWVQVVGIDKVYWDMRIATKSIYLIPSITTSGYAHEVTLYGFDNPSGPVELGVEISVYADGPSSWISDNDTALWTFSQSHRYFYAILGGVHNNGDAQIDALCLQTGNNAPIADAGPDQTITLPTNSVTLNGSASYDIDNGNTLNYIWTFVSGPSNIDPSDVATPAVTGLVADTYVFELKVTDNLGASSTDTVRIVVNNSSSNSGNGGGGGISSGRCIPGRPCSIHGQVLGAEDVCILDVNTYMRIGYKNKPTEVGALQAFLNEEMDSTLAVNGIFDQYTEDVVKAFQLKYSRDILGPWDSLKNGEKLHPTGIVYKTTLTKIKNLKCKNLMLPTPSSAELTPWIINHFTSTNTKIPTKTLNINSNTNTSSNTGVHINYSYYYGL